MPSHDPHKVIVVQKQSLPLVSLLTTLISVLFIVAGAIGLVFLQQPLQETSQDVRSEATVSNGPAILTTNPGNNSNLQKGQEAKIDILLNTSGIQAEQVDLVFSALTGTTDTIVIQTYDDVNLEFTQQEVEQITDGLLIHMIARPRSGSFSSSSNQRIASIIFNPSRTGEFKLSFDPDQSHVYQLSSNERSRDILNTVTTFSFNVIDNTVAVKSCNESCSSNAECAVNHRCYENRCRLVTNLSSTSCTNPGDQGLQRQCNEYCADSRECASGFTCFFNRCRRPDNPDSESCALTTAAQQQAIAESCNDSCNTNADCAVNLRCFQGSCRLATNVSSTSCSPVTKKTVSLIYDGKGGSETPATPLPAATLRPVASPGVGSSTSSGTATGSAVVSPRPSVAPTTQPSPSVQPLPSPMPEESNNFLVNLLDRFGVTLPLAAMTLGFVLLFIVILLTIINQLRKRRGGSQTPVAAQKASAYESELQAKIEALKNQPPAAPPSAPPLPKPTPQPLSPTSPAAPSSPAPSVTPITPMTPPPSTLRPQPTITPAVPPAPIAPQPISPQPVEPPTSPPPQPTTTASSMIDRIKQKGIVTPGQNPGPSSPSNTQG